LGALDWILRHEIAHIALNHAQREITEGITYKACETEADTQATRWLQGTLRTDPDRQLGTPPARSELDLEWRGISIGLGIIWIALFEAGLTCSASAGNGESVLPLR
jgi:hypothetical protein